MQTVTNSAVIYQKFIDEEIMLLEILGCISKSLSPGVTPVIIVPKNQDPLNPQKQQLYLVSDHWSLNKSINTVHNCNSVISYYPLPNITDLLEGCISVSYLTH